MQRNFTASGNLEFNVNVSRDLSIVFDTGATGEVRLQRFLNGDWRQIAVWDNESTEDIIYSGEDNYTPHRLVVAVTSAGSGNGIQVEV